MLNLKSPLTFILYVIANLFIMSALLDFGVRWHSAATYVANNVTVTLDDGSILKGTLTSNWAGEEVLTGGDKKSVILGKYQMLQIPMEGQPDKSYPFRIFFPLLIYVLLCSMLTIKIYNRSPGSDAL
ncbi:hypothetical protein ACK32R_23705 [Aeromonas dhakensis]|uniref:hypothetical protein n=1 Tax=Aeromonas dhakensis TaxID=196024 RepID=UPI0039861614